MKRTYSKPSIYVEPLQVDTPIAANCTADKADMNALMILGYFTQEKNCSHGILETGGIDTDQDGTADGYTTVCYHSNVQIAFTS